MTHRILINGRYLSPERAAREMLPLDTPLACPSCNSFIVEARNARSIEQLGGEAKAHTPRHQDRQCLACGHRWTVVLPPEVFNDPLYQLSHGATTPRLAPIGPGPSFNAGRSR